MGDFSVCDTIGNVPVSITRWISKDMKTKYAHISVATYEQGGKCNICRKELIVFLARSNSEAYRYEFYVRQLINFPTQLQYHNTTDYLLPVSNI